MDKYLTNRERERVIFYPPVSTLYVQSMHSIEVTIRICQAENSDVHRGEAENITFEG